MDHLLEHSAWMDVSACCRLYGRSITATLRSHIPVQSVRYHHVSLSLAQSVSFRGIHTKGHREKPSSMDQDLHSVHAVIRAPVVCQPVMISLIPSAICQSKLQLKL